MIKFSFSEYENRYLKQNSIVVTSLIYASLASLQNVADRNEHINYVTHQLVLNIHHNE